MPTEFHLPHGLAVGDNLKVRVGKQTEFFCKITNRDTIFLRDEAGNVDGLGTTEPYTEVTNLNPPVQQVYQIYGIIIDGNIELYLKQPSPTNRWGTQRVPAGGFLIDRFCLLNNVQPVNIWITQDFPPSRQIVNNTNVTINPIFWWLGWKYEYIKLEREPEKYTCVVVGGLPI